MASSMCGQDKPNSALCLANRAGRMALCRAVSCKKIVSERHERNPLLTKLVRSRLLDIGLVLFFCEFMDPDVANIQPSWPHTWRIVFQFTKEWNEGSVSIIDKVILVIVHHQKCICTQKSTTFTPVQRGNMQSFNDISLQKLFSVFRDFFRCSTRKNKHMFAILTFYFSQFLKKAWQQAEASVVKINFNSNRIQKNREQLFDYKSFSRESVTDILLVICVRQTLLIRENFSVEIKKRLVLIKTGNMKFPRINI